MQAAAAIWSALWLAGGGSSTGQLRAVPREQLCITNGVITTNGGGALLVDSAEMRAVVASGPARIVEARLRYLGPTKEVKRLASGELRRQFGLKLRAANTCNVVYVMWHIEPDTRIAASVKSNPGLTTHAQCDAHGYRNLKPSRQSQIPVLGPHEWHRLRASLAGETLAVSVDGATVWQGNIGADGMSFDGPVGMRSDNGRFEVELFQSAPEGGAFPPAHPCQADPGETE
ncbi:MAG TPA: hypothetical protein VN375_19495 [Vicinamibacteria bacterium]|nr:hypothetical protein [Vicinamibacteria bacterium]